MESGTGGGGYDTALEERHQTAARKASPNEGEGLAEAGEHVGLCTTRWSPPADDHSEAQEETPCSGQESQ